VIKLSKVKQGAGYQRLVDYDYTYKDWTVEGVGGFTMIKHYWVHNAKLHIWFWQFKLYKVKELLEKIDNNPDEVKNIDSIYLKPLYG